MTKPKIPITLTEYEPMIWMQDGEPDHDGFGDQYDVITKPGNLTGVGVGYHLGEVE